MKHIPSRLVCSTAILLLMICLPLQAAKVKEGERENKVGGVEATKDVLAYSFAEQRPNWGAGSLDRKGHIPLGSMTTTASSPSPGQTVGWTWYDYQHNCGMGRMIETGPHSGETGPTTVHFGWMHLPDSVYDGRTYMYNAYKSLDGLYAGAVRLHDYTKYSGYVNVDVTPDNRALVGGHCDEKGAIAYNAHIHFDFCSSCELFNAYVRVPDSLSSFDQKFDKEAMWPRFLLQFGTDTVLHIVTRNWDMVGAIMYFRKVGYEGSPEAVWDYPPYVVDTIETSGRDLNGQRTGDRVAMSWLATPPYQEPECDTCSGLATVYDEALWGQMDNDVYVQVSDDQGENWLPRENITQVGTSGEAGYRAYCDLSLMFDQSSNLHVIWQAAPWSDNPCFEDGNICFETDWHIDQSRIFHWSENIPYIRTICDHTYWPGDSCGAPNWWSTTVAKMSISECDGKLYTIWSQFNDLPNEIVDDCALWGYEQGSWSAAANADIWVSVSSDDGMTWDAQRNLTNSYTPRCDPWGSEDCQSDYYASMSRWGKQVQTGEDWSGAEVVDPSGGASPTDWFLDIQYVNDLDAGAVIWEDRPEGTWTNNPIKWFRLPCVEPIPNPLFIAEWYWYGDPHYIKPGETKFVDLDFENAGNVPLTYSIAVIEDNGPAGWLGHQNYSGAIPSGLENIETGQVILNVGGVITSEIGGTGNYFGRLHVTGNDPINLPCDIEIELIVADTLCAIIRDVVNTNIISLAVSNYGNMGNDGQETVNMDFYPEDCDSTAQVYLYDGSPFIGRGVGPDATFDNGVWQTGWTDDYGFRPQCGHTRNEVPCNGLDDAEVYESGTFSTQDSAIAIEKIWVAPAEDVSFIIQYMRVWSFDGNAHDDVMVGEVLDWDIPWDYLAVDPDLDTTAVNSGHIDGPRGMLYCQGYEAYGANADTGYPYNCQNNDARFGGHAFVESYLDGSFSSGGPDGGFCGENDDLVYPANEGFLFEPFYDLAVLPGLSGTGAVEDLFTAMTYEVALDIGPTTVYEAVTVLVTIENGDLAALQAATDAAKAWYFAHGGMTMFKDLDDSGTMDICEQCCVVMGDFNHDGGYNPLDAAAFVNWMWRSGPAPFCLDECDVNCSGAVDPLDAAHMVAYFWGGGPPPCTCAELP